MHKVGLALEVFSVAVTGLGMAAWVGVMVHAEVLS